jgi:pimeloyl-ACP methyl ester carboxylesterase
VAEILNGSSSPVTLQPGVSLQAPNLVGTAELKDGVLGGTRAESNSTDAFIAALDTSDFQQLYALEVRATEAPVLGEDLRAPDGAPGMTLRVPDLGPEQPQVLMMVDEAGVVTWHLPSTEFEAPGVAAFTVDRTVAVDPPEGTEGGERGLAAAIGAKLLSVFVVPLVEKLVGRAATVVARHFEEKSHPYGLRRLTPNAFRKAGADPLQDWGRIGDGRVLLFLHGTASSSHGAFAGLPDETFMKLHAAYDGHVMAFDHHTLSASLDDNVKRLLPLLPPGRRWPVDIISHSRGGLVARKLAEEMQGPDAPLDVRKIVYVATPNGGTALANPDRLKEFLDRISTMINLIPDGPWSVVTDVMAGVLTLVQVLAVGAVGTLPGLVAMQPLGTDVKTLGFLAGDGTEQYGIDVEFEPTGRLLQLVRGVDGVVDRVFEGEANDIVVPTGGVCAVASRPEFRIAPGHRLELGATSRTWHCSLFSQPAVSESLLQWLAPAR